MELGLKDLIGPVIAAVAVTVGILQYRSTAQSEFIKPVREAQLKLYQEATSAAAMLATLERDSPAWKQSYAEFYRLYYGPLALVEDFDRKSAATGTMPVEDGMILFRHCLENPKECQEAGGSLHELSLALAHVSRQSLARSWGYSVQQLDGDYQQHAIEYRAKICSAGLDRQGEVGCADRGKSNMIKK
jgi:hypothetical protein